MQITSSGLVIEGTKVLGRIQQVDLPTQLARTCQKCGEPIPLRIWDAHKVACYLNVRECPIASFEKRCGTKRSRNHEANTDLTRVAQDLLNLI